MGLNYVAANVLRHPNSPFYRFKSIGLSITRTVDSLITDSAAGATAIATGYKTKKTFIGVNFRMQPLKSFFEYGKSRGLSTGIVVTDEVCGATPSPFLVHHKSRYDKQIIASKMLNDNADVVIGGGLEYFLPESSGGARDDNKNLIDQLKSEDYNVYYNLNNVKADSVSDKFYALLANNGLPKASHRDYSLGELTDIAINHLKKNKNGFLLMVEGSQIDWAGHDKDAVYALSELEDFATAVSSALNFADENGETLVIVTADHETGGLAITGGNKDGSDLDIEFLSSHHTGGFVGVFANGPGQELFNGIYDINMIGRKIFHLIEPSYQFLQLK